MSPALIGECLSCSKLSLCTETSPRHVIDSYTCSLYQPVAEPIIHARLAAMSAFGLVAAFRAIVGESRKEEFTTMNEYSQYVEVPPGTTASQRQAVFDTVGFGLVRYLGAEIYKCFTWNEALAQASRPECRRKVLEHELSINKIVPDQVDSNQGVVQMSQPFQPPMPGSFPAAPQQKPMPPNPPAVPAMPSVPQMMTPPPPPPVAPPVPATPVHVATAEEAATPAPKKRGRPAGASAAPPPPPPTTPQVALPPQPPQVPQTAPWQSPAPWSAPQAPNQVVQPVQAPTFQPTFQPQAASIPQPPQAQPDSNQIQALGASLDSLASTVVNVGNNVEAIRGQQHMILLALYHLYMVDPSLASTLQKAGIDISTFQKFQEHLTKNLPR